VDKDKDYELSYDAAIDSRYSTIVYLHFYM